ncbi:MAG: serine/threonine-protein kinase [Polyangiales bacterium]
MDANRPPDFDAGATVVSPLAKRGRSVAPPASESGETTVTTSDAAVTTSDAAVTTSETGANTLPSSTGVTKASTVSGNSSASLTQRSSSRSESALRTHADAAIASAMLEEEGERARGFSAIVAVVTLFVGLCLPFLGGDRIAKLLSAASLAAMGVASAAVFWRTREPKHYAWWIHRSYGFFLGAGVAFVEYYLGVFSPVPVILTLAVLFFGQSGDRIGSFFVPAWLTTQWLLLASAVTAGLLPDRGLFSVGHTDLASRVFAILAVLTVLGLTHLMARISRASLVEALQRSHGAMMVAHERLVQLEEAKANFDRALGAVVGKAGRYSGARAGDYVLDVVIGVGAMGEVYAASREGDSSSVAVKLLQAEAIERTELVERFLREGEICRKLSNPHVVRVLDVGRMEDGAPFLAMERLYGEDLASRLRRDGHLSLVDAATLAREVGKGLVDAHAAGVVHRDLKPQNIFHAKGEDGIHRWKLLDFGVSKLGGTSNTLTEHQVVGTPGYMSPEQARGIPVDARSDVFSLGVVLYRVLTGHPAFTGPNVPETLFEICYRGPRSPQKLRPELPSDLEHVFAIALAKEPEDRFQSAQELVKAFTAACRRDLPSALRLRGEELVRRLPWSA